MQARHRQRLAGGHRAADVLLAELTMGFQGDDGRLRVVPVGVVGRLLQGPQGGAVQRSLHARGRPVTWLDLAAGIICWLQARTGPPSVYTARGGGDGRGSMAFRAASAGSI